jgi:enoyl-CoA hydratase/carnithine racemase
MLTANLIDTSRALEWGLVDGIAESQQLDAEVERVLAALLACGPQVMRSQKRLLNTWDDVPLSEGVKVSIKEFGNAFRGEEPYYFMSEFLTRKRGT